jgi:hypothetical protein
MKKREDKKLDMKTKSKLRRRKLYIGEDRTEEEKQ